MRFTQLLQEIQATYREQPRAFHVMATRYYIGAETRESLEMQAKGDYPTLTTKQVEAIIANR